MSSILVVCTGNVCRSPVAEASLRRALDVRLGQEAPHVASAGTAGWEGAPATEGSIRAAREQGIDLSGHVARLLTSGMVEQAGLVLAMAGEHRRFVVGNVPSAAARTFTLKELVTLLVALPASDPPPPWRPEGRLELAHALRTGSASSDGRRTDLDQDVADPLGMPLDTYRAMTHELIGWTDRLVEGLFGPVGTPSLTSPGGSAA